MKTFKLDPSAKLGKNLKVYLDVAKVRLSPRFGSENTQVQILPSRPIKGDR